MFLYDHELELVMHREPQRTPCYYCGIDCCPGGCGPQIEAEMAEERRQRAQEECRAQLDALAIEKREIELIHKLRLEESARVEKEIEQLRAEYEANVILLEKAREQELSDALQRAGAALENE
jgi:hypothetical protein